MLKIDWIEEFLSRFDLIFARSVFEYFSNLFFHKSGYSLRVYDYCQLIEYNCPNCVNYSKLNSKLHQIQFTYPYWSNQVNSGFKISLKVNPFFSSLLYRPTQKPTESMSYSSKIICSLTQFHYICIEMIWELQKNYCFYHHSPCPLLNTA